MRARWNSATPIWAGQWNASLNWRRKESSVSSCWATRIGSIGRPVRTFETYWIVVAGRAIQQDVLGFFCCGVLPRFWRRTVLLSLRAIFGGSSLQREGDRPDHGGPDPGKCCRDDSGKHDGETIWPPTNVALLLYRGSGSLRHSHACYEYACAPGSCISYRCGAQLLAGLLLSGGCEIDFGRQPGVGLQHSVCDRNRKRNAG